MNILDKKLYKIDNTDTRHYIASIDSELMLRKQLVHLAITDNVEIVINYIDNKTTKALSKADIDKTQCAINCYLLKQNLI